MSEHFDSNIEGERHDTDIMEVIFDGKEEKLDEIRDQLLLSLDDLKILAHVLPWEVEQNCADAYREGKEAEDMGDWAGTEEAKRYIRGRLIAHNVLQ